MRDRIKELIDTYALQPHPEGGLFCEVYETPETREDGRRLAGSIYFLLRGEEISHLHQIDCEEIWYHHEGAGLRITMIDPETGAVSREELGADLARGQRHMVAVPKGRLFATEAVDKSGYGFVSCVTAPRFAYAGFRMIGREELKRLCPAEAEALEYLIL